MYIHNLFIIIIIISLIVLIKRSKTFCISSSRRNSAKIQLKQLYISLLCRYCLPQRVKQLYISLLGRYCLPQRVKQLYISLLCRNCLPQRVYSNQLNIFILCIHSRIQTYISFLPFEGGWMICHFSIIRDHFVFCKLNFVLFFFISCKMIPHYVYYYCILIRIVSAVVTSFFFRACFTSFHYTHASLLTFVFCFFILFHSCCFHSQVFGKTLVHEFPISNSHTC